MRRLIAPFPLGISRGPFIRSFIGALCEYSRTGRLRAEPQPRAISTAPLGY
jgi:hypothetical protein